ncbi:magnesium-translocating P-type ATPase [Methylotenera oryzisoli]|uniref:Magnesium-transporting ATPase, P-type 1 n=1 Tax=Methylotenera oryzisoli TaxID=2080758 RepID=A0A4Y9VTQ8_9PROT|nr:magnesium-translocating P-type ATPase [Methylotenera oryzisoli]TFW73022.1 magnesium-translocating P-type ATPase [Methylotenera oryzisoli]
MQENFNTKPWWLEFPNNIGSENLFEANEAKGLTSREAKIRLAKFGFNTFNETQAKSLLFQYLQRFKNPLVIILLVASAISAFTGELTNFLIISFMVLLSVTLDFFQEYRANAAALKLKQSVSIRTLVLRDGLPQEIDANFIVPGDIVMLSAGNLIPADGVILEAKDFFVRQALLTGESYPVEKRPDKPADTAINLQDASNALFMGTSVISGSATMLVIKTGADTAVGEIADKVSQPSKPTSFEIGTHRFGLLIMRLTIFMVMFVLFVNAYFHKPWLESFLFAVALAVGLTPELLPMVVSVTLSRGAMRMAKKKMIVKRLSAIQDLGSMDVLCTDKTGTLTEAKIKLEKHIDALGKTSERVIELAYFNSFFESGLKSPLDEAIISHQHVEIGTWKKVDEVPFDFERRRVSVLIDNGESRWLIVKGAPDEIIGLCSHYELEGAKNSEVLDEASRLLLRIEQHKLEEDGFRVLGIAWRKVTFDHQHAVLGDEAELVFVGFAAFLDPPKEGVAEALESLKKVGVAIKIVTGDSELVTRHVCNQLKISVIGQLTGAEVALMDDYALRAKVESINLFCRMNPSQKDRVILALKSNGHVVGYLGDGINDAPPLHSADVGMSVESAVDVAKEAADIILLKQDLHVLHAGVMEGRRTFSNIMKYMMMGTSSNFGNMFSMAGAALFLPFLPMLPTQILLNNILYDISELPIPLDKVDAADTHNPRVLNIDFIRNFMFVIGPISSMFDFLTFYVMLVMLQANEQLFQTGWFVESLCTQVMVIFIIRTRGNPLKSHAHPLLIATSLMIVGIAIILPFTSIGTYFGFVSPPTKFYLILGGMMFTYLCMVELAKQVFYHNYKLLKVGN